MGEVVDGKCESKAFHTPKTSQASLPTLEQLFPTAAITNLHSQLPFSNKCYAHQLIPSLILGPLQYMWHRQWLVLAAGRIFKKKKKDFW